MLARLGNLIVKPGAIAPADSCLMDAETESRLKLPRRRRRRRRRRTQLKRLDGVAEGLCSLSVICQCGNKVAKQQQQHHHQRWHQRGDGTPPPHASAPADYVACV